MGTLTEYEAEDQALAPRGAAPKPAAPRDRVTAWREERLLRTGVDPRLAAAIAADCAIDLHAMIDLIERGCPPRLAARILAPLDEEHHLC